MKGFYSHLSSAKAFSIFTVLLLITVLLLTAFLIQQKLGATQLNPIEQENRLPGTTAWQWSNLATYDLQTHRYPEIEGYARATSAIAGDTLTFSVSTTAPTFTAAIYRLGWYQGKGGRLLKTLANIPGHFYPMPPMDPYTGLLDPPWPMAFSLYVDPSWVTGMYVVKLTSATGKQGYIPFVVRSARPAAFVFVHGDTTDQAYNPWGGKSLYNFNSTSGKRAYKVSFNRPLANQTVPGMGFLLLWEYPMIRWFEQKGYDLEYVSSVDIHNSANLLKGHSGILIVGHNEYWTKEMRDHLEAAVTSGVNLANFAANSLWWQIRYEPSRTTALANRIIVCYKDAALDPLTRKDNSHVTVNFISSPVHRPEQLFLGNMSGSSCTPSPCYYPLVVADASNWIFAGTNLKNGDLIGDIVGYEYDKVNPHYLTPPGDQIIATSPVSNSTVYTTQSGARVFDGGSIEWSWGLDPYNLGYHHKNVVSSAVQQITQNILQNFLTSPTPTFHT